MDDHELRIRKLEQLIQLYENLLRDLKIQIRSLEQQLRDARGS